MWVCFINQWHILNDLLIPIYVIPNPNSLVLKIILTLKLFDRITLSRFFVAHSTNKHYNNNYYHYLRSLSKGRVHK